MYLARSYAPLTATWASRTTVTSYRERAVVQNRTFAHLDIFYGHKITAKAVKPMRGECRSVSAEPVCSCAFLRTSFAHETAGAARTRHSLLPLSFEGQLSCKTSGAIRAARS